MQAACDNGSNFKTDAVQDGNRLKLMRLRSSGAWKTKRVAGLPAPRPFDSLQRGPPRLEELLQFGSGRGGAVSPASHYSRPPARDSWQRSVTAGFAGFRTFFGVRQSGFEAPCEVYIAWHMSSEMPSLGPRAPIICGCGPHMPEAAPARLSEVEASKAGKLSEVAAPAPTRSAGAVGSVAQTVCDGRRALAVAEGLKCSNGMRAQNYYTKMAFV